MGDTTSVQIPEVHYARSGDVAVAYQVIGSDQGSSGADIVFVRGMSSDLNDAGKPSRHSPPAPEPLSSLGLLRVRLRLAEPTELRGRP